MKARYPHGHWTLENCKLDALNYATKAAWKAAKAGYNSAKRKGFLDACCAHMRVLKHPNGYWTLDRCKAEAQQHTTRLLWSQKKNSGYGAAVAKGWLSECCSHMDGVGRNYWTLERCKADALKYSTKKDWTPSAYSVARANGWVDECCGHMVSPRTEYTKSDCIYIWKAVGQFYRGNQVYKIGITNSEAGDNRIISCARSMGFDYDLLILANVGGEARCLETLIHSLGCVPQYDDGNGYTEFRALSGSELFEAIDLIKNSMEAGK